MSTTTLAGIAIGLTAALAGALALRLRSGQALRMRRLIELEKRMQIDDMPFASLMEMLDDLDRDLAEYRAVEQAEMMEQVDFAIGYDARIEPFERFLEGLDARKN